MCFIKYLFLYLMIVDFKESGLLKVYFKDLNKEIFRVVLEYIYIG